MIWEPFLLALVLGLLVSAGLYVAYLWPSVEPLDEEKPAADVVSSPARVQAAESDPRSEPVPPSEPR